MRRLVQFLPILLTMTILITLLPISAPGQEFRRAQPGYTYQFPRDHGAHPDFRNEWWYFTGNVSSAEGRQFGYMFTIFRVALTPPGAASPSSLAANQLYFAHFAITDADNRKHESWDRFGRVGFGQAEGSTETLAIRVGQWSVRLDEEGTIRLRVPNGDSGLALDLRPSKPFVIHGKDGYHRKSGSDGLASHYISFTRLATTGTLRWQGRDHSVTGWSWKDQEFGSDQLAGDQVGWDWFALQLDTGEELMIYQIRNEQGERSGEATSALVLRDGTIEKIPSEQYEIRTTRTWTSPHTGGVYPMGWIIALPRYQGELRVEPVMEDQEMQTRRTTGTSYWEGAIRLSGTWRGARVTGKGYVELVGYSERFNLL